MGTNNSEFGETVLSVISLLESAVTGNLLNNQPIDGMLYSCHQNIMGALTTYLNNSAPSNEDGRHALNELNKYVKYKQSIFNRKYALDETGEFEAVTKE